MAKTANPSPAPIDVAIYAYPECSAWITAGLIELFAIANVAMRGLAHGKRQQPREFRCHAIARTGRAVRGSHGVRFSVEPMRRRYDAVVVPPLWGTSRRNVIERLGKLGRDCDALNMLSRRAALMAGTCTGTVLLAQAGLLAQRRATTCWWMVDWFRSSFPDVKLDAEPLVVADGNRWTAAAGSAYIHLGLQLVGRLAGDKAAAATARLMLVERRRGSQSPFLDTDRPAVEPQDTEVARMLQFLERNANTATTIHEACRRLRLNARTLSRKFQSALGMSPLTYLQSCRIARAKRLLQDTRAPLDEIIGECGYEDASSFRKLFARHVGMTPREFRARFGQ